MKIGLRIPGACGKEETPEAFTAWCREAGFDAIDLSRADDERRIRAAKDAGLEIGTFDLPGTGKLLSADEATRREGIETVGAAINAIADAGGSRAFCVFIPPDHQQSRRQSLENWKASFPEVAREAERRGVRIAVEGYPGPNNCALGVTPETLRAMFEAVPSEALAINYDPSHLVRIGVDYLRFLTEFGSRVVHTHGKDCTFDSEAAYLFGNIGPSLTRPVGFGGGEWRYCIPGEGLVNWAAVCARLQLSGYRGMIAIELEDFRYNGTVDGEKRGLARAKSHLALYS